MFIDYKQLIYFTHHSHSVLARAVACNKRHELHIKNFFKSTLSTNFYFNALEYK